MAMYGPMTRANARVRCCASTLAGCIAFSSFWPVAGLVEHGAQVLLHLVGRARVRAGGQVLPDGSGEHVELGVTGQLPAVAGALEHLPAGVIAVHPEARLVALDELGEVVDRAVEAAQQEALARVGERM